MTVNSIPAHERVAYVNRLIGEAGAPATACYQEAIAAYRSVFDLAQAVQSESERDLLYWISANETTLALRRDWPADKCAAIAAWLEANTPTLDALRVATEYDCAAWPCETVPSNRLMWAVPVLQNAKLRTLSKLVGVCACQCARAGNWSAAYAWSLRIQRMAAHVRLSPWPFFRANADAIAEFGCRQLRMLLAGDGRPDRWQTTAALRQACDCRCRADLVREISQILLVDEIEITYAWARDPASQPQMQDAIVGWLPMRGKFAPLEHIGATMDEEEQERTIEAYRQALQRLAPEAIWPIDAALRTVCDEWERQPLHEALATRAEYSERYKTIARRHPITLLWNVDGLVQFGADLIARARLEGELAAIHAVTAVLEHRQQHGKLPDSLAGLQPPAQPWPPVDTVAGMPFTYAVRPASDSFELRGASADTGCGDAAPSAHKIYWPPTPPDYEGS